MRYVSILTTFGYASYDNIVKAATDRTIQGHFIGSIVYLIRNYVLMGL
jgi:hypothetical protein